MAINRIVDASAFVRYRTVYNDDQGYEHPKNTVLTKHWYGKYHSLWYVNEEVFNWLNENTPKWRLRRTSVKTATLNIIQESTIRAEIIFPSVKEAVAFKMRWL